MTSKFRTVIYQDGVPSDFAKLPSVEVKTAALKKILDLQSGLIRGRPLHDRKSTGNLSDCFKVYFDSRQDVPPRYRIVYRELNNNLEVVAIEVLAIGERSDLEAYLLAAERLGRLEK